MLFDFDASDPCSDLLNKDRFNISDTDSAGSDFGDKSYKDREELDCGQCHECNAYCEAESTSLNIAVVKMDGMRRTSLLIIAVGPCFKGGSGSFGYVARRKCCALVLHD